MSILCSAARCCQFNRVSPRCSCRSAAELADEARLRLAQHQGQSICNRPSPPGWFAAIEIPLRSATYAACRASVVIAGQGRNFSSTCSLKDSHLRPHITHDSVEVAGGRLFFAQRTRAKFSISGVYQFGAKCAPTVSWAVHAMKRLATRLSTYVLRSFTPNLRSVEGRGGQQLIVRRFTSVY